MFQVPNRPIAYCDLETYKDYFLCKFLFENDGTFLDYVLVPGTTLNKLGILLVLARHTIVTFNGSGYDCPILALALSGASNQALKDASDVIITRGMKPWDFYRAYNVEMPSCADHIDIMELLPGVRISLKTYGGIAHCPTIQDLPIEPSASIDMFQRMQLSRYCLNDLLTTQALYKIAVEKEWISIREHISAEIGIDVRSKSDAQISEAITIAKLGFRPQKRVVENGFQFTYQTPSFVTFQTDQLREVQRIVACSPFTVLNKDEETKDIDPVTGKAVKTGIRMHKDIEAIRVKIGSSVYKFGAGGLHSQEHGVFYETNDEYEVCDDDVGSFYPKIIINQGLYPVQCGPQELVVYTGTYHERMAAKFAKRKKEANSKKIVLNGKFGKLGSKYSIFFAPELLMQTTISGQLMLLMLIEALELAGISVVSANTDGIVTRTPRGMALTRKRVMMEWEAKTDMQLETTYYRGIYLRDVNNYFAITMGGEVKRKGLFTPPEVGSGPSGSKAPHREICSDAVIAYVKDGTPIEQTIYRCRDIRKFVSVRASKSGAVRRINEGTDRERFENDDVEYLGKVIRWVYRQNYEGAIYNKLSGNQVADSKGAWPVMTLPDRMPDWIDYEYYVRNANAMLKEIGIQ
jgi:hypothetical protein